MNCPNCRQPTGAERNYCGGCGTALARYCIRCGFRNQVADRFCGGCGATMEAGVAFVHAVPADVPQKPPEAAPRVVDAPPTAADDLAELLAAAKEGAAAPPPDPTAKVSQDDIDSLFGD